MKTLLWIVGPLLLLFVVYCTTSPTGRKQLKFFPESQLGKMGEASFNELKKKLPESRDTRLKSIVNCVSQALLQVAPTKIASSRWEIRLFQEDSPNAFALPGGYIGVHTGIFKVAKNADQLGAVIGHEIAHVTAGHGNERVSSNLAAQGLLMGADMVIDSVSSDKDSSTKKIVMGALGVGGQLVVLLPYSRSHESEADQLGLRYLHDAGFNVDEAPKLWQNMKKVGGAGPPEFLSTHPAPDTRIRQLSKWGQELKRSKPKRSTAPNCRY